MDAGIPGSPLCNQLTAVIPASTPLGSHTLETAMLSGCTSSVQLLVRPPPRIRSVAEPVCLGNGTVLIEGEGLFSANVFVDGVPHGMTRCGDGTCATAEIGALALGAHRMFVHANYSMSACPFGPGDPLRASLELAGSGFTLERTIDAPPAGGGTTTSRRRRRVGRTRPPRVRVLRRRATSRRTSVSSTFRPGSGPAGTK